MATDDNDDDNDGYLNVDEVSGVILDYCGALVMKNRHEEGY
jgi:hypothetical protein